jgi:hypothetical protein
MDSYSAKTFAASSLTGNSGGYGMPMTNDPGPVGPDAGPVGQGAGPTGPPADQVDDASVLVVRGLLFVSSYAPWAG